MCGEVPSPPPSQHTEQSALRRLAGSSISHTAHTQDDTSHACFCFEPRSLSSLQLPVEAQIIMPHVSLPPEGCKCLRHAAGVGEFFLKPFLCPSMMMGAQAGVCVCLSLFSQGGVCSRSFLLSRQPAAHAHAKW